MCMYAGLVKKKGEETVVSEAYISYRIKFGVQTQPCL
jgi:hypothetical protein